ncbi:two-component system response regulator [Arcanobacterium hippocoleae]|uniref:DNA-binding NarL/FixJ family response regulator n=1 Tax=Arcanobacterium hippocoleae TaxID=149017 RepID=A0ABU1T0J1_9ACTO|nr:two-component system response regulator [Arcanobacterium hippocoleae]MDR6938877.1 DNA-binding NarL/FixJ family response regulator [Arcanobacterium hippocoleae]
MAQEAASSDDQFLDVLVYSDNRITREEVMRAIGSRIAANLPEIRFTEAATWEGAELKVQERKFDLLILDAETPKLGGIGLGMKIRDEIDPQVPYIVIIARPQDDWLARVAKPRGIVSYPIDPRELSVLVREVFAGAGAK